MSISQELSNLIIVDIKDDIVFQLMERFDNEIIPLEDEDDPMKPSNFREEFENFIGESITSSVKVTDTEITFGIGSAEKLGFSEELDADTTDGLKIIGTILQGISGEYVLVTTSLAKGLFDKNYQGDLGRTGRAYLMKREEYDRGVAMYGWPEKMSWKFSNFPGIPDFFDKLKLNVDKYIKKLGAK